MVRTLRMGRLWLCNAFHTISPPRLFRRRFPERRGGATHGVIACSCAQNTRPSEDIGRVFYEAQDQ
jgi:hypothetical protein